MHLVKLKPSLESNVHTLLTVNFRTDYWSFVDAINWTLLMPHAQINFGFQCYYWHCIWGIVCTCCNYLEMAETSQVTQIVGDILTKDSYNMWSCRMENFFMGKGLWDLVTGKDECNELPESNPTDARMQTYKTWKERSRKVLHWISKCISETHIHFKEASTPKEAQDIIHKMYGTIKEAKKIQVCEDKAGVSQIM